MPPFGTNPNLAKTLLMTSFGISPTRYETKVSQRTGALNRDLRPTSRPHTKAASEILPAGKRPTSVPIRRIGRRLTAGHNEDHNQSFKAVHDDVS